MSATQRKPDWKVWPIIAMLVPVLYAASFGPACWGVDRGWLRPDPIAIVYRPVFLMVLKSPRPLARTINAYMRLFAAGYWVYIEESGAFVDWKGNVRSDPPNTFL